MSITVRNLQNSGCGCSTPETVKPTDLVAVPSGSTIVQSPCADNCAPLSSAGLAQVQQESENGNCDIYKNPCVLSSFQAVDINKNGTMFATCASTWGMPGLRLYFPGLGYIEVLGVSGDVVTYRNLTIEGGTEILAGVCFHHDAPGIQTVSDGGNTEEDIWQNSATLDAVYGDEGNVKKKIVPVNGMILQAEGGKWVRRQAGQMRYPITPTTIVNYASSAGDRNWTVNLPSKPTNIPVSSPGLGVELSVWLHVAPNVSSKFPQVYVSAHGSILARQFGHPSASHDTNSPIVSLDRAATQITINADRNDSYGSTGTMIVHAKVTAYHY